LNKDDIEVVESFPCIFVLPKTDCILLLCGWHGISYIYVFKVKRFLCYEKQTLFNYNVDGMACFIYIYLNGFLCFQRKLYLIMMWMAHVQKVE